MMPTPYKAIATVGADGQVVSYGASANYLAGPGGIGYDAVHSKGKRFAPLGRVLSEDLELRQLQRRQLSTTIRDLNRNFSIAAWLIRQHLDYVSTFHFRSKTGDKGLDTEIQALMDWWSRPENCDPAGRHRLARLIRMWEMRRVIDGDVGVNRLADGKVQTVEGDRIQSEGGVPFVELGVDPEWVINGVWTTPAGKAIGYLVFRRQPRGAGMIWDRMLPARFCDLFGYFDRYDQVRGISPLAAAANSLRDVYEGFDYALVKAKVTQLFGIAMTRAASEELGGGLEAPSAGTETDPSGADGDEDGARYKVDFGKGPVMFDLDPGDDVSIIESQQPSDQFQAFTQSMVMVALKALDVPFSFYDESHTNYSGARLAGITYEKSVHTKRGDLRALLDKITAWRLGLFIADGDLKLPKGFKPRDLKWEWAATGMPWYDPMKEVSGAVAAVSAGLSSQQRECKKLGLDFFELIDERAEAEAYASSKGVVLSTALAAPAMDDPASGTAEQEAATDAQQQGGAKPAKPGAKPQ